MFLQHGALNYLWLTFRSKGKKEKNNKNQKPTQLGNGNALKCKYCFVSTLCVCLELKTKYVWKITQKALWSLHCGSCACCLSWEMLGGLAVTGWGSKFQPLQSRQMELFSYAASHHSYRGKRTMRSLAEKFISGQTRCSIADVAGVM